MTGYIAWMRDGVLPRDEVGGKGASLSALMSAGFEVPDGFCITAQGYRHYATTAGLTDQIARLLASVDTAAPASINEAAERITSIIHETPLPDDLATAIRHAYKELTAKLGMPCAVRSSSIAEDGSAASFAGLHESFLNVRGADEVIEAVHRCYASLWSERAVGYRARRGENADEAMAVVVMGLVPCDTAGIAFTAHPVTASMDQIVINSSFGLGEAIVSGRVTPDSFVIDKHSFAVLEREIYPKTFAIYPHPEGDGTVEQTLPPDRQKVASLTDEEACAVARLATRVEEHYGTPQDIEWGLYGGDLYLLQSRPITTLV